MQIDIAQDRRKGVGVFRLVHGVAPVDAKPVGPLAMADEQAGVADGRQRRDVFAAHDLDALGARLEGAHDAAMRPQEGERIGMAAFRHQKRLGDLLRILHVHSAAASPAKPAAGSSIQSGRLLAS